MTRFSKLRFDEHGKLIEEQVRDIEQRHLLACPHCIMIADHYNQDGTCRCDDPAHDEMHGWGYVWNGMRWDVKPDDYPADYDDEG